MTNKRDALAATSPFDHLRPNQLDDIARLSDERHIEAGTRLCWQHEFGTHAFVIADGRVAVDVDGDEVAVAGPGQLIGDWALLGTGRRSATLRALTAVDVVVIDPREMDSVLAAVPQAVR
jgi:CRP-like cAMP-binding protein